jgi:hypothetical protein
MEASGVISSKRSRRSVNGSTIFRWNAAMTPAAVRPRFPSLHRASNNGFR